MKKIIFYFVIIFSIFIIYTLTNNKKETYIAIGDGLALGYNIYEEEDYGYNDYYIDYLKNKKELKNYEKYSNENYNIRDILNLLNTDFSIRKKLRESTVVTISLGMNDIYYNLMNLNEEKLLNKVDNLVLEYDHLLKEIKKYAKKDIVVIGVYNPVSKEKTEYQKVEKVLKYMNNNIEKIAIKNETKYVNIYNLFKYKEVSFSNNNYYPDKKGYYIIFENILKKL